MRKPRISVVTPTLSRPQEVADLLDNLSQQTLLPVELVLVDAGPPEDCRTKRLIKESQVSCPFSIKYFEAKGGTAVQRNIGVENASGEFIAFIDDDIRLERDYFEKIISVFEQDTDKRIGAVAGMIKNQYLDFTTSRRWRWYKRLRLFSTYEPGRFDHVSGYPINRYLQPPHEGVREIDCVGSGCTVWRAEVFEQGVRFAPFFTDYGVVEDAHLALQARKRGWRILEYGPARCVHLHASGGRTSTRRVARKTAVNYRFLFVDIVPRRTIYQELRFYLVQFVQLGSYLAHAVRNPSKERWGMVLGKVEGIAASFLVKPGASRPPYWV